MNGKLKTLMALAVVCIGTGAFARNVDCHNRNRYFDNDGLNLAAGIVDLVCRVIAPQPVVVTPVEQTVIRCEQTVTAVPVVIETRRPVIYKYPERKAPPPPPHRKNTPKPPHNGHRR